MYISGGESVMETKGRLKAEEIIDIQFAFISCNAHPFREINILCLLQYKVSCAEQCYFIPSDMISPSLREIELMYLSGK